MHIKLEKQRDRSLQLLHLSNNIIVLLLNHDLRIVKNFVDMVDLNKLTIEPDLYEITSIIIS